jgi:superfamily II DNA or RNA helicase
MNVTFNTRSADSYRQFLQVRKLPLYSFAGSTAYVPDEYADLFGAAPRAVSDNRYSPSEFLFDYQRDISALAIKKRKYAVFADCGLGKTLILLEFARHAQRDGRVLIVSPLMVARQTISEAKRWYGDDIDIGRLQASELGAWLEGGDGPEIAVTNYESINDRIPSQSNLAGLILDESSMLKNHYGKWGTRLIELGRGVEWKLCCTGTPAPNDRIEFANHAVFLDRAKTTNEFLATYFVNRGQTQDRWALKSHALKPFYRSLADWSIFLNSPATYGWEDNVETLPPIHVHIDSVPLTPEQRKSAQKLTGNLVTANIGGIGQRSKLSQIAKGKGGMPTNKPDFIRDMIASWPDESTLIWCQFNDEQDGLAKHLPNAHSISGSTVEAERERMLDSFMASECKTLISKPKILGFGLNLQVATRQVFSGIKDSYEEYYQAVKRSNRIGSTKALNVHIPVTELEEPFIENVLRKAERVESDTREQEELFKEFGYV